MVEMSIHRALAELKTLDKRIARATQEKFLNVRVADQAPKGYPDADTFIKEAEAAYQSVTDLINRRNKIKAAITKSNAATLVTIAGKQMSVADAIDRRDTGLVYERELLNSLRTQLLNAENVLDQEEREMQRRLESRIASDLGNAKDRKPEEVAQITDDFVKRNQPNLLDPINVREQIKKLTDSIEQFAMEVDFSLSESNAETKIQIED